MIIEKFFAIFHESDKSFEEQEKGEVVVILMRRHPFVALIPLVGLGLVALLPIVVFIAYPSVIISSSYFTLYLFLSSVLYMVLWLIAFRNLMMYTLNTVIVTDRRIIDRDQHAFFDRKVSELHIYRIQDITVSTKGVIPTLLHYGDVIVQTAGIEQKFVFHEMPNPEKVKTEIMKVVSMANAGVKGVNNSEAQQ